MELFLNQPQYEADLSMVHNLMKKLETLKEAGRLRKKTDLCPVLRNKTRWSGTFRMVDRYIQLIKLGVFLNAQGVVHESLEEVVPGATATSRIRDLFKKLEDMESVNKMLQNGTISLWLVRKIFDDVIELYPFMGTYLKADADIVESTTSKPFEMGIVKV
jgi:hypothetical protein